MKKIIILLGIGVLIVSSLAQAKTLKTIAVKSFAKLMNDAIEAKDAPASCWYLGLSQGYLRALKDSGNSKASQLLSDTQNKEGKCGGINTADIKKTFTNEEWARLNSLQKKIESTEL